MRLMQRFLNCWFLINSRVEFTATFLNKQSVLKYRAMSEFMSHKILTANNLDTVKVQVLGSGAVGVPSNVLLIIGQERYLINCGEGTQKLGFEYKIGLQKIKQVFITSPSWKNISGLLGVLLSRNKHISEFNIHGHSCIENIFSGTHKFISYKHIYPNLKRFNQYEEFSDFNVLVKYVLLYSKNNKNSSKSLPNTPDKGEASGLNNTEEFFSKSEKEVSNFSKSDKNNLKTNGKNQNERSLEKFKESPKRNKNYVISYIFHTPITSGPLNAEKCIELGVPPGPLLGVLKNGNDVTLSDGKLIKSVDVKEPDIPGVNIIVVECPSEDYLDSLLNEPIYSKYQSGEDRAAAVIHFSSSEVVKTPKYQAWIKRFEEKTKHLFINEDNKLSGSVSIHRQQFKLNYLQPTIFPLLQDADIPDYPRIKNSNLQKGHILLSNFSVQDGESERVFCDKVFYKCESNSFINGETLCELNLKSKFEYDYMNCLVLKKNQFLKEMFKVDIKGDIEKCKKKLKDIESTLDADKRIYPKIVFLGTGSGSPSKTRNVTGILIFLEENKCMILDCGENTFNQLIILYGKKKTDEILRNLIAIFISHLHVDHHMGLVTLLKNRKLAFDKQNEFLVKDSNVQTQEPIILPEFRPVFLLAPGQMMNWLDLFSETFENISELFVVIPNSTLISENKDLKNEENNLEKSLNLSNILTTPVCHTQASYGISITHEKGWKITYSGDTKPCDDLVRIGMDSDILIHEATFEDAWAAEAKLKNHSTTSEALEIGRKMGAKYILLTHFSQRYCYLPVIENNFKYLNIGMAFDFMEVPFNKLPLLPALLEPVQYIFSEYDTKEKTDNSSLKRKQNEESISSTECSMERKCKSAKVLNASF